MDERAHDAHPDQGTETPAAGTPDDRGGPTRRQFVTGALAFSGLAMAGLLDPADVAAAAAGNGRAPAVPPELLSIGQISSKDGRLRGVLTLRNAQRTFPGATPATPAMMRYFEGKDASGNVVWPPADNTGALPAPTLRARVGDHVQLTFLNHVHTDEFGSTLDRVEHGMGTCDTVVNAGTGEDVYPGPTGDAAPNCFHGSSTANIHWHGTHMTPDGLGDNVLLQLRPDPGVTEASVRKDFEAIFNGGPPRTWDQLPLSWRTRQLALLRNYDETAPWNGQRGGPDHSALPPEQRLLPPTEELIRTGQWPQYQIGAFPYCFDITRYDPAAPPELRHVMGQAPGTHWYHAHKHGSTALNVYNVMAGVFIIEGEYDDALRKMYPPSASGPGLKEQVLVVHNVARAPNLMRTGLGPQSLLVNGQQKPAITMRPGEIQLWRFVNASVRAVTTMQGFAPSTNGPRPEVRQLAQDGVQFSYENYTAQPRVGSSMATASMNAFAAGNRVDLLVRAPTQPGSYDFVLLDTTRGSPEAILTLVVPQGATGTPMQFPSSPAGFPAFPAFLADIPQSDVRRWRKLDFGWEQGRSTPNPTTAIPSAPKFMINGEQFKGGHYDQTMVLGDTEEWQLINTTSRIAHPFHIHVNPFQVVEIYDPATDTTYRPAQNFVWQDTVAIPPSKLDDQGNVIGKPGSVTIRHRFVDFTGSYVLHCHMLAHEDRGMMQLVRVISSTAAVPHH